MTPVGGMTYECVVCGETSCFAVTGRDPRAESELVCTNCDTVYKMRGELPSIMIWKERAEGYISMRGTAPPVMAQPDPAGMPDRGGEPPPATGGDPDDLPGGTDDDEGTSRAGEDVDPDRGASAPVTDPAEAAKLDAGTEPARTTADDGTAKPDPEQADGDANDAVSRLVGKTE